MVRWEGAGLQGGGGASEGVAALGVPAPIPLPSEGLRARGGGVNCAKHLMRHSCQ